VIYHTPPLPLFQWALAEWWQGVLRGCARRKAERDRWRSACGRKGWRTRRDSEAHRMAETLLGGSVHGPNGARSAIAQLPPANPRQAKARAG
jgi:hypothetical protein